MELFRNVLGVVAFGALVALGVFMAVYKRGDRAKPAILFSLLASIAVLAYAGYKISSDCFPCGAYKSASDLIRVQGKKDGKFEATYEGHCSIKIPSSKNPNKSYLRAFSVPAMVMVINNDTFTVSVEHRHLPECASNQVPGQSATMLTLSRVPGNSKAFKSYHERPHWTAHIGYWERAPL